VLIKEKKTRVNNEIQVRKIRLIDPEGNQIGIVPVERGLDEAENRGLDLVEIVPNAKPPVCKIMDYGKYLYEQSKKERDAKRKQHKVLTKEIRLRPKIEKHDLDFKIRHMRKFLEQGNKVKVTVMFKGRELSHMEFGFEVLDKVKEELDDIAKFENEPKKEHRNIVAILSRK